MEDQHDSKGSSDSVNPYASPAHLGSEAPVPRQAGPSFTEQNIYVSSTGLRKVVVVVHFVLAAAMLVYCLAGLFYLPGETAISDGDIQDPEVLLGELGDSAKRAGVLLGLKLLYGTLDLAALILLSIWCFRAYRNLSVLSDEFLRFQGGWVVAYWYIPVVSLFRPVQVVNDIWRLSVSEKGGESLKGNTPIFVVVWWALRVVGGVANAINVWIFDEQPLHDIWITFLSLVSVVLGALLVRFLGSCQDAKAQKMGLKTV